MYDTEKRVALVKSEWQNTTAGRCSEASADCLPLLPPCYFLALVGAAAWCRDQPMDVAGMYGAILLRGVRADM